MVKKVTLRQVADRAGVSFQTVSKVLNYSARVTKDTEERIWQAVQELGYRPNLLARNMRQQRSHLIGYSWEPAPKDQGNPILDGFLQSMAQAADEAGYHVLTFPHHPSEKSLEAYDELISTRQVDGFVISSVEYDDPRVLFLIQKSFPFVAFGRSTPGLDFMYVDVDGGLGLRKVVRHLLSLGHQRIYMLAWPINSRVGQNREEGYWIEMRNAGIEPQTNWIVRGEGTYFFGYQATIRLLNLPEDHRPTAIVCLNDFMAVGAMKAAQNQGYRVGKDIAITGFDDIPMSQYLSPSLTTVRQPLFQIGQIVISMLVSLLEGSPPEEDQILLPPWLVVRQSSNPECQNEILI